MAKIRWGMQGGGGACWGWGGGFVWAKKRVQGAVHHRKGFIAGEGKRGENTTVLSSELGVISGPNNKRRGVWRR